MIAFGPWLPDQPSIIAPHLRDARNVIPAQAGYQPFRDFVVVSAALTARARGAAAFRDEDGTVHMFAGDATKLYELQSDNSWLDVSRTSGGAYTTALTSNWRFGQYGDTAIAVNLQDATQAKTMSTATAFAALGGSPPKAKHISIFRDFVVLGYTANSAHEVAWSGINDPTGWTSGVNQSDSQILPDGGYVQGFAATDVLIIFQQRKIRIMQYVGPPVVMQIDVLEEASGCLADGSIAQHGRMVFYLADDGFHVINSGAAAENIGEQAVNDWFFADCNEDYLYRMSAAVDPDRNVVYWCYASVQATTGNPDTLLIYHWPTRKWAYVRTSCQLVFNALALGYTLDGLNAIATTGIDLFQIPLDDPLLSGGSLKFGAFDGSNRYGAFVGLAIEATIETGDFELRPGGRVYVSGVQPVTDADSLTVSVAARERAMDAPAYTSAGTLESHGLVSLEASGRYCRSKLVIGAGDVWTHAQGLDFEFAPDGAI